MCDIELSGNIYVLLNRYLRREQRIAKRRDKDLPKGVNITYERKRIFGEFVIVRDDLLIIITTQSRIIKEIAFKITMTNIISCNTKVMRLMKS